MKKDENHGYRSKLTRRRFLANAATAVAIPYFVPSSALGKDGAVAPSERIVVGTIGSGGMGRGNARHMAAREPGAQVVAMCDVDEKNLGTGINTINREYRNKDCKGYSDYRKLLARDDIDAVIIATPDHWHALNAIAAANAKKDIYGQKPMTHTFAEGQALIKAVKRNNVIYQVGSQQRSQWKFRHAVNIVRNGHIGKIKRVEVGLPTGHRRARGNTEVKEPPAWVDYDFWCGPSKKLPFIEARFHFNWRWNLAYGGGQLMDWIGHHNDIAHWGMNMDGSGPREVKAAEFTYPEDRSVYDSAWQYEVLCKYDGGIETSISNKNRQGCKWVGDKGWVFVSRGALEASNKDWVKRDFDPGEVKVYDSPEHHRNFLNCVKSRKSCICPAEIGHRSITPGHLGLLSEALGKRTLKWDPAKEEIVGDAEADKLLKKIDYRRPWSIS